MAKGDLDLDLDLVLCLLFFGLYQVKGNGIVAGRAAEFGLRRPGYKMVLVNV